MIIWYTVPEIWRVTDVVCIFHFGLFFALLPPAPVPQQPPLTTKKLKTKHLEILSPYTCVPEILIIWCTGPEIWCETDGRMNGQKKWHIEVPNLKRYNNLFVYFTTAFGQHTSGFHIEVQSWPRFFRQTVVFLRQTVVYMWNSTLREKFNFYFSRAFC